jgi:LCP family protein required for cell wall assembly
MVWAIVSLIFFFLPTAIVAIVHASKVDTWLASGDTSRALEASRKAKTWCWVSTIIAVVGWVAWLIVWFVILGAWGTSSTSSSPATISPFTTGTYISSPSVSSALASTPSSAIGTPSGGDILVLGIDRQPTNQGEFIRSDGMMLIHADPEANYLSVLSLPRDLRVEVPGSGPQKLNWAYSHGGAELAIQTVKELTGVNVGEYVEIDLQAFRDLTDEVGGVYIDVDKRYFNADPKFELIDLLPGYQLDTNLDFGRMDRQQRFFTALREQAMGWDLPFKLPGLVNALFDNVKTNLGTNDIIELAYWAVTDLDGSRIRQMTLDNCTNQIIDGVWYVIPAEGALEDAVEDFMTAPEATSAAQTTVVAEVSSDFITDPEEIADSETWFQVANQAPFQVMAPGHIPQGYDLVDWYPSDGSGAYKIVVGDEVEKALKFVYQLTRNGEKLDQYLGIMETTWLEAPAASPGQEVEVDGVVYTVVGTGQSIDHVWWKKDGVLYWVSNTLSHLLQSSELLKVAQSMIEIPSGAAREGRVR